MSKNSSSTKANDEKKVEQKKESEIKVEKKDSDVISENKVAEEAQTETQDPKKAEPVEIDPIQDLAQQLADQKIVAQDAQEKCLRTMAEFENFKRRKEQEKEDAIKFSLKTFFEHFLPILDSFHQAENSFSELDDQKALVDGFNLIHQQLHNLLEKNGVLKISALDQVFDPHLHQAVMQEKNGRCRCADHY